MKDLEQLLTGCYKAEMVAYVKAHPNSFNALIKIALADDEKYAWRASWLLWSCMNPNDARLRGHLKRIVALLPNVKYNRQREFLVILDNMDIGEELEGNVIDACVHIWEKRNNPAALRCRAMKLLVKLARKYPELNAEIKLLLEPRFVEGLSCGAKHSVGKMAASLGAEC